METFYFWLRRRTNDAPTQPGMTPTHAGPGGNKSRPPSSPLGEDTGPPPHIVGDELLRAIWAAGPEGITKRGLLAYLRTDGGEEIDELIRQWISIGEIEAWRSPDGETLLRWTGHNGR